VEGHSTSIKRSSIKGVVVGTGAVAVPGGNPVAAGLGEPGGTVVSTISAAHAAIIRRRNPIPIKTESFHSFFMESLPEAQKASLEGYTELDPDG
jgi:hypothetical protein